MDKYTGDFTVTGTITVRAMSKQDAIAKISETLVSIGDSEEEVQITKATWDQRREIEQGLEYSFTG